MDNSASDYLIMKKFHEIYVRPGATKISVQRAIDDHIEMQQSLNMPLPAKFSNLTVGKLERMIKKQTPNFVVNRPYQLGRDNIESNTL